MPFDIDEESLEDEFSEYGKINYVKIVINPKTGQPKGKLKNLLYIYKHSLTAFTDPLKNVCPLTHEYRFRIHWRIENSFNIRFLILKFCSCWKITKDLLNSDLN